MKNRRHTVKKTSFLLGIILVFMLFIIFTLSILPSERINSHLSSAIQNAEKFRKSLLMKDSDGYSKAEILSTEIKPLIQKYIKTYSKITSEEIFLSIQGKRRNIDLTNIFDTFRGIWKGKWKTLFVRHCWDLTFNFFFARHPTFSHNSLRIHSLQYAWVGDGFGWNAIVIPSDDSRAKVILGTVFHLKDSTDKIIDYSISHVGIAVNVKALVWITNNKLYFEEINSSSQPTLYNIYEVPYRIIGDKVLTGKTYYTSYRLEKQIDKPDVCRILWVKVKLPAYKAGHLHRSVNF